MILRRSAPITLEEMSLRFRPYVMPLWIKPQSVIRPHIVLSVCAFILSVGIIVNKEHQHCVEKH